MPRQKGKNEIPAPTREAYLPLLGPPFNFEYMNRTVLKGKVHRGDKRKGAAECIRKSNVKKAKYLLYLVYVGAELQKALRILELTRTLEVEKLQGMVRLGEHPAFKATNTKSDGNRKITDHSYLTWHLVLSDLLHMVRSHVDDFIAAYQLASMPLYPSEIPIPE